MGSHDLEVISQLTARERQVAVLAHYGLSNKLVAKKLNVSEGTVKQHLHSIFLKLHIRSRSALIIRKLPRDLGPDALDAEWLEEQRRESRINQSVVNGLGVSADFRRS
jgi:two-component system nitrate/nitrite response regulator NarP